jgi:hypothetical protein
MPCQRCNGTGFLPQYYYIEGGICFLCNGKESEKINSINKELPIKNNTRSVKNLFSSLDDVLKRLGDLNESSKSLFLQEGFENTKEYAEYLQQWTTPLQEEKNNYQIELKKIST